ncbi:MAG: divergent PAP2 family protein [Candidatus Gastranaerophilales bacterium]|nr:divergent PAP2 family protein [Candidatus Gastranaerophilales bacterium]
MIVNTGLEVIFSALIGAFAAQMLKFIFYYTHQKRINFKILTETGGMPSSHSAFVLALATSVGIINGYRSVEFAIALGFSMVIMYDAAGLRRSAGRMAVVLNKIVDDIYAHKPQTSERLIELLGHTPLEVIMGGLLGIVLALAYHILLIRY